MNQVLFFSADDYIPYNKLENTNLKIVIYKAVFSSIIEHRQNKKFDASIEYGLVNIILKMFSRQKDGIEKNEKRNGIIAVVLLKDMHFQNETVPKGSLIIFGSDCQKIKSNKNLIFYYETNFLPDIYKNVRRRFEHKSTVSESISELSPVDIPENKMIGKGSFANIFSAYLNSSITALKVSRIKPEAFNNPYSLEYASWHEVNILTRIIMPLIQNKICPNLPLIYGTTLCPDYSLKLDGKKKVHNCVCIVTELASGNLKEWFSEKRSDEEVYSALFQIMAGLCAIQLHGQIMNYDVKKENILFYKVIKGGHWKYIINEKTYYVPNTGFLFILSDFGVARPMSPFLKFFKTPIEKTFRLGHRYAAIINDKFIPLQASKSKKTEEVFWNDGSVSNGIHFEQDKKSGIIQCKDIKLSTEIKKFLISKNVNPDPCSENFYSNSNILPPFEFYNDTQDAIKMLIGGKRSTQEGNHKAVKISKAIVTELEPYKGKGDNMAGKSFSLNPNQVLASYFIKDFFSFYETPQKKIIETYIINVNQL